uniref:Uncharacterized protein n=1 Tax=Fagus sylvatica TaxID=28930 RepID=A0A2N9G3Z5_FAGSY
MGGAILTSYIGAICGNRISRSFGMNRGYFRASKLRQARSRPPPTDRSSPDLSLYGGKTAIRGGTRRHVPMGTPALHSRAAAACKLNNGVFRAPIQKAALPSEFSPADLSFGIGIAAIRVFTRLHASSRLRRNSLRASTRGHATACVRHTRPRSWHMPEPRVASLCSCIIPYRQL